MNVASWFSLIGKFAPFVLSTIPGVPPAIIPYVAAGIQSAETIPGATGQQKLAAAVTIAQTGFAAAQAAGAHVDAQVVGDGIAAGTSAVVNVVNAFHKTTQPDPKPQA